MDDHISKRNYSTIFAVSFFLTFTLIFFSAGSVSAKAIEINAMTLVGGSGPPSKLTWKMAEQKYQDQILIKHVSVPYTVSLQKVMAEFVGRSKTYDIIPLHGTWLGAVARYMEDLLPYVKKYGFNLDVFPANLVKGATWQGRLVGFPFRAGGNIFFYRKDLYKPTLCS